MGTPRPWKYLSRKGSLSSDLAAETSLPASRSASADYHMQKLPIILPSRQHSIFPTVHETYGCHIQNTFPTSCRLQPSFVANASGLYFASQTESAISPATSQTVSPHFLLHSHSQHTYAMATSSYLSDT